MSGPDDNDNPEERSAFVEAIDNVVGSFGLDNETWPEDFLDGSVESSIDNSQIKYSNAVNLKNRHSSFGEALYHKSWWALPMEYDDDVSCGVVMNLRTNQAHMLSIVVEGISWVNRVYIHKDGTPLGEDEFDRDGFPVIHDVDTDVKVGVRFDVKGIVLPLPELDN